MKVVIVDDERLAVLRLQQILECRDDVEIVGAFTMYSELLKEFPRLRPDVAFLDIDMPGMNGLELASSLIEMDERLEVVFITAYDQYALEAFRVNAVDYLLKPVDEGTLGSTISRISRRRGRALVRKNNYEAGPRVQCFGPFNVHRSGFIGPIDFPTAKAEELLAFFLTHRDTNISKWLICESLWPEHDPHKAEQNLHTTVFRMKKTLLEHGISIQLSSKKGFYRFQLLEACDLYEFEELKLEGNTQLVNQPAEAERILRQYKGPLFGFKDYTWCEAAREQAARSFRDMSKAVTRAYMKAKEYRLAHDFLQFVLTVAPYDEESHELLLRIYLHWKDRNSFFHHYNKMKEALYQEAGMELPAFLEPLLQEMMKAE